MSYEDEDNEYANGAANRFDGLEFLSGGPCENSRPASQELRDSYRAVGDHFKNGAERKTQLSTTDLMREFHSLKLAKENADAIAKELNRRYDFMRLKVVPDRFEEEGISNIKVEGVGRVQLAGDLYAGIVKGKEADAFEFLRDNGRGDVVKETVNSSSLKAIIKAMIVKGEELPEGVFKAEPFTRASIVKA